MTLFQTSPKVALPFDADDPSHVAAAWTGIVEPGDPAAGILRELLGEKEGLRWIFAETPRSLPPSPRGDIPWRRCHARWHPRAAKVDVTRDLGRIRKMGGGLLHRGGPGWPAGLADLEEREPFGLWFVGAEPEAWSQRPAVSIVGSRAATNYGTRTAAIFSYELAGEGTLVVSGGAYGIDAAAHRGALKSGADTATVSVLCGGLGNLYPRGNIDLFKQIRENGALVSEVPPHWRPARWRFLERNRLIAALGQATIIVEASQRSGAIATANRAADLGREVGAVPGPVTSPASAGAHQLIQDGAMLVGTSGDIQRLIGAPGHDGSDAPPEGEGTAGHLSELERVVLAAFPLTGSATAEELALAAGLGSSEVELTLLQLKMRGMADSEGPLWSRPQAR